MVEELPEDFVRRSEEIKQLRSYLLSREAGKPVTITAALKGAGGYGKTTLAMALCHDENVKHTFDDGILWVPLGKNPSDLIGKIEDLIYKLTDTRPGFTGIEAAADELGKVLSERNVLLVIDDIWDKAHLKPFIRGTGGCSYLITTRILDTLPDKAQKVDVNAMRIKEAIKLLSKGLPMGEEEALSELAGRLGEWPMLLKLVNKQLRAQVHAGESLPAAIDYVNLSLDKKGLTFFDARDPEERNLAVEKTIGASLELLKVDERDRFSELAIFPEDTNIPLETVGKLWLKTGGCDEIEVKDLCGRLYRLSLLLVFDLAARSIRLHDIIHRYLVDNREKDLPQLHAIFLDSYLISDGFASWRPWANLPIDEPYLWDQLTYHLSKSGNNNELRSLFTDDRWLHARIVQSEHLYSGYLVDLSMACEMADEKLIEDERYFADRFQYGLIRASIISLAANYVPELVVAAVENELWTLNRALSVAEQMSSKEQACKLYSLLLAMDGLSEARQRTNIGVKALDTALTIHDERSQANALVKVAQGLSGAGDAVLLDRVMDAVLAIEDVTT